MIYICAILLNVDTIQIWEMKNTSSKDVSTMKNFLGVWS